MDRYLFRGFWLGVLLAWCYLAYEFGGDIVRWRTMAAAVDQLDRCETDMECAQAFARLQAVKGVR